MALISLPYVFTVGSTIVASQHNSNFNTIYNDYNGNITDSNIASNAAIGYAKLALNASIQITDLAAALGLFLIPSGGIIMWNSTIATIPSGWFLCDGTNGTPDLRDKFIPGAKQDSSGVAKTNITGSLTQSGGSTTIAQGNLPNINLNIAVDGTTAIAESAGGNGPSLATSAHGGTSHTLNVPLGGSATAYTQPYFALAYIMKS